MSNKILTEKEERELMEGLNEIFSSEEYNDNVNMAEETKEEAKEEVLTKQQFYDLLS